MGRPSRFSPEVRERAVRMVEEHRATHASEWGVLQSVAPKLGCTAETLRKWVRQAQRDAGYRPGLTTSERERLKELEREVRELKRARDEHAHTDPRQCATGAARALAGPHRSRARHPLCGTATGSASTRPSHPGHTRSGHWPVAGATSRRRQ